MSVVTDSEHGPRFDPKGPRLVYVQIADEIAAMIHDGTLAPESRLPSEAALAEEYGTARNTAARAIRYLRDDLGLVETVPGKGSYVLAPERRRAE